MNNKSIDKGYCDAISSSRQINPCRVYMFSPILGGPRGNMSKLGGGEEKSRKTTNEDPFGAESYHTSSNQICELDKESHSSYSI